MTARGWAAVSIGVSAAAALVGVGLLGAQALFGAIEDDPRLPDHKLATERIYGDLRPKTKPPFRARVLTSKIVNGREYRVEQNRTGTRFWYTIVSQGLMIDYASTTSQTRAQGWIDAINEGAKS